MIVLLKNKVQKPFVTPRILTKELLRNKILSALILTHIIIIIIIIAVVVIYFLVNTHKEEDRGTDRKSLQGRVCLCYEPLSR